MANAQTLWLLNFNPMDTTINTETDYERIMSVATEAAAAIDYGFISIEALGTDCTNENLMRELDNLKCDKNDIILFYYSGHGSRAFNDKSDFPQLCLNHNGMQSKWVPMHTIVEKLQSKNARLTLVLSDCCNKPLFGVTPKSPLSDAVVPMELSEKNTPMEKNYKKLFLESRGLVVATSSKKGQVSYPVLQQRGNRKDKKGGAFSFALFEFAMEKALQGHIEASWQSVLKETAMTMKNVFPMPVQEQEPYYELNVQSAAAASAAPATQPQSVAAADNALASELSTLLDKSHSLDWRLEQAEYLAKKHFSADAKVATVARNGSTIVEYESALDFLRRIASSAFVKQVNIIKAMTDPQGKHTYMKVQEIRLKK